MPITKLVDGVDKLNAECLNRPLYELEEKINDLEFRFNQENNKNNTVITEFNKSNFLSNSRVVYFNGSVWDAVPNTIPIGELIQNYPLGVYYNGIIYLSGLIKSLDPGICFSGEAVELGKPYFLTGVGQITKNQPDVSIYVGQYISQYDFLLDIQIMTYSHLHRRTILDPTKWQDKGTYLLYPVEELGQLPLPVKSTVLVLWGKYLPKYGPYLVDVEGIKIIDFTYFSDLTGEPDVYLQFSTKQVECFWSDPKCLTTPGVMSIIPGTSNMVIENNIPGQPPDVGNLVIKNIPVIETTETGVESHLVIKNIKVNDNGELEIEKGPIVERIVAGSNTTISSEQGTVIVNSNSYKHIEHEFSDVFLKGALSKLYPGTINTYIEFPSNKQTAAIFKSWIPFNVDPSKEAEIYISYFGTLNTIAERPLNMRVANPTSIQGSYSFSNISVMLSSAFYVNKILIKKIDSLKPNSTLYLQIEREVDNMYRSSIGIINCIIKYYVL